MNWALFVPDNPTALWTMILTFATIGFTIVAWRGLKSFKLAKADYLTRNTRDARACAINRCEEFAREMIRRNAPVHTAFAQAEIAPFQHVSRDLFDAGNELLLKAAQTWIASVPPHVRWQPQAILNDLESWAMYFTQDLADESVAFGPCSPVFCSMVLQFRPYIIDSRSKPTSGKYPNLVTLFGRWKSRMDATANGDVADGLWKQLVEVQARAVPTPFVKPIGTHDDT
jgi:hypothetical protein